GCWRSWTNHCRSRPGCCICGRHIRMSLGQTKRLMEVWWMEGSRRCRIFQLLMGVRKNGGMLGILRKRIGALTNLVTPLADVDEEEISDDQEDFEEGELNENTEARLKTTRKAPKGSTQRWQTNLRRREWHQFVI
ncbi:unnamed protein product, partial [Brassica rapa]